MNLLIASTFQQQLFQKGYSLVERDPIEQVLEEQGLQWSDGISGSGRAEVGEIINVDALLVGNVPRYRKQGENFDVIVQARLVDVDTGEIMWSGTVESGGGMRVAEVAEAVGEAADDPALRDEARDVQRSAETLGLSASMLQHTGRPRGEALQELPVSLAGGN